MVKIPHIPHVSVIIPYYNEGVRIIPILEELKKIKFVKEIIVVDDGSTVESQRILQNQTEIRVIRLGSNKGKAFALKIGVDAAHTDVVTFIDSDLRNFKTEHLNLMVGAFFSGKYDMLIGDREKEFWLLRRFGYTTMLAGERVIRKNILMRHRKTIFSVDGYFIEAAINKIFFHNYSVGKIVLRGVGQYWKVQKSNVSALFFVDLPFTIRLIHFLGVKEFIFQLRFAHHLRLFTRVRTVLG